MKECGPEDDRRPESKKKKGDNETASQLKQTNAKEKNLSG